MVRQIERQPPVGIEIDYVTQEVSLGIAHYVGCLESAIEGPFLLFLGDIYFHAPKLEGIVTLFRESQPDAVLGAIEEAAVGAGAVVRNSVVFAGARVPDGCVLDNVIVKESEVCCI